MKSTRMSCLKVMAYRQCENSFQENTHLVKPVTPWAMGIGNSR